jgi:hypothetical protein
MTVPFERQLPLHSNYNRLQKFQCLSARTQTSLRSRQALGNEQQH